MRQSYKVILTSFFIVTFVIVNGLMLLGTQTQRISCEQEIIRECVQRGERPICPNLNLNRCPLDAAR